MRLGAFPRQPSGRGGSHADAEPCEVFRLCGCSTPWADQPRQLPVRALDRRDDGPERRQAGCAGGAARARRLAHRTLAQRAGRAEGRRAGTDRPERLACRQIHARAGAAGRDPNRAAEPAAAQAPAPQLQTQTASAQPAAAAESDQAAEAERKAEKAKAAKAAKKARLARERARAEQAARASGQFYAGAQPRSNQQDAYYYGQRAPQYQNPSYAYAPRQSFGPFGW